MPWPRAASRCGRKLSLPNASGIAHGGDSMVIDALGNLMYHKHGEEDIHTITLEKEPLDEVRQKFPFWKDADQFRIMKEG